MGWGWQGESLSLYLFSLRILLGFLFLLFRDPGLSGSGPLPLGICYEPLPVASAPHPWVALAQHPGRPLQAELDP